MWTYACGLKKVKVNEGTVSQSRSGKRKHNNNNYCESLYACKCMLTSSWNSNRLFSTLALITQAAVTFTYICMYIRVAMITQKNSVANWLNGKFDCECEAGFWKRVEGSASCFINALMLLMVRECMQGEIPYTQVVMYVCRSKQKLVIRQIRLHTKSSSTTYKFIHAHVSVWAIKWMIFMGISKETTFYL